MDTTEIYEIFEKYNDDYIKFEKVTNKLSHSPDLHAFLLIEKYFTQENDRNIISAAEHDIIYIHVDRELLEKNINEDIIRELVYCGISFDEDLECFYKHV